MGACFSHFAQNMCNVIVLITATSLSGGFERNALGIVQDMWDLI
jgi:hypothetical protein